MATVKVAVKYSNREHLRIYEVSSDADFAAVKDVVKATGAKYDGAFERKWWVAKKADLDALKAAGLTVKNADFEIDTRREAVIFVATGESAARLEVQTRFGGRVNLRNEDWERLAGYRDELQAAYNKSDEALGPVFLRIAEECARLVIIEE